MSTRPTNSPNSSHTTICVSGLGNPAAIRSSRRPCFLRRLRTAVHQVDALGAAELSRAHPMCRAISGLYLERFSPVAFASASSRMTACSSRAPAGRGRRRSSAVSSWVSRRRTRTSSWSQSRRGGSRSPRPGLRPRRIQRRQASAASIHFAPCNRRSGEPTQRRLGDPTTTTPLSARTTGVIRRSLRQVDVPVDRSILDAASFRASPSAAATLRCRGTATTNPIHGRKLAATLRHIGARVIRRLELSHRRADFVPERLITGHSEWTICRSSER